MSFFAPGPLVQRWEFFIPIALGILVVISALVCFYFIFVRLKINHIIKKLLIFANVQQAIGFGIFVTSIISHASGFKNKLTCFLAITSLRASVIGNQASITAISIIRYSLTGCIYVKLWSQRPLFIELILDEGCNHCTGATGATPVAPKFSDTLTLF